jgi:hypothetical protein
VGAEKKNHGRWSHNLRFNKKKKKKSPTDSLTGQGRKITGLFVILGYGRGGKFLRGQVKDKAVKNSAFNF